MLFIFGGELKPHWNQVNPQTGLGLTCLFSRIFSKQKSNSQLWRFSNNLELCSWALSDAFVGDSFVCIEAVSGKGGRGFSNETRFLQGFYYVFLFIFIFSFRLLFMFVLVISKEFYGLYGPEVLREQRKSSGQVLEELQSLEQQRRGTFRRLDGEFDIIGKAGRRRGAWGVKEKLYESVLRDESRKSYGCRMSDLFTVIFSFVDFSCFDFQRPFSPFHQRLLPWPPQVMSLWAFHQRQTLEERCSRKRGRVPQYQYRSTSYCRKAAIYFFLDGFFWSREVE